MKNVCIIVQKQLKDTLKNKTVLIQFILFPIMTLIMENAIHMDEMPELFFTKLFSVMYVGMAPLTATASIISEEKEKNTLRVLTMANVKPWQYLLGVGVYVWTICTAGACIMATGFPGADIPLYLLIMGLGFALSIVVGACIGICAKNQMIATSLVMPVMMVLSFTPMLAMFNDTIEKIAKFFYTQQMRTLLEGMTWKAVGTEEAVILGVNALLAVMLFFAAFKRKGLE